MNNKSLLKIYSWVLAAAVTVLAVGVWAGERLGGSITAYTIFPLLGLVAFSLMWTHYVLGSTRRLMKVDLKENKQYFKITGFIVLFLILLHPGILIATLYRDGFGLPPNSYLTVYAEPAMKGAIMLGTISLLIFLAYELHGKFKNKSWWKYVEYLQILAMFFIFYHGLTLGRELSIGWYKTVWYLYGVSLLAAVIFNYWYDKSTKRR